MKYRVTHRTRYTGADSVSVGHNQAWLEFRPADRQQIESFSLQITPEPSVRSRRSDAFGNP
ncbi:MAG: transglutaminase N-terminal domain-containing protein, partial [Planctomyces sp.]